jgi:hypothetical protein
MSFAGLKLCTGVAVLTLAFAGIAAAQSAAPTMGSDGPGLGIDLNASPNVDPETAEKRREIERAYRNATQKIPPAQTAGSDPWANMRGADEGKPAAKSTAKSATRTTQKTVQKKKTPAQ